MSEHDDTQIDDFMDGKSSLNSTYRAGRQEEPSAALDARILALANEALSNSDEESATPQLQHRKRPKWLLPLSVAATVMLGVNLAYNLKDFSSKPEFESGGSAVMSDRGKERSFDFEAQPDSRSVEFYELREIDSNEAKRDVKLKRAAQRELQTPKMEEAGNGTREQHPEAADTGITPGLRVPARPENEGAAYNHKKADDVIVTQPGASQLEPVTPREDSTSDDRVESRTIGLIDTRAREAELDSAAPQAIAASERTNSQIAETNREARNRQEELLIEEETTQTFAKSADTDNDLASFSTPPPKVADTAPAPVAARTIKNAAAPGLSDNPCRRRPRSNGRIEQIINSKSSASPQHAQEWLSDISAIASNGQVAQACLQLDAFEHVYGKNAIPEGFPVQLTD